ncbi:class I SAM-dependent methyltransferase [Sulfuriferula nivalis]|uniref:Ubiquinone/menaquinone biosynthesis methyltransferase n=1 Tax=Sulfuriferula nivalis TaxID=2675298 RepID=A0A809S2L4_9PROT|nr:class I SAM-dependent methyltransferase [Sulfuriferula nivalis]BBP00908.1 ubiquinone/menaquinone biosynthesis methyltransferase [Sulfuriferula nivalis]
MQIAIPDIDLICDEQEIYEQLLPLAQANIIELGCGKAEKTRAIAKAGKVAAILALEVDAIQHAQNLTTTDLPNVCFELGCAENIPAADASMDIVLMFKSLHHVPVDKMDLALAEVHRVLKPGGLAYISEPIYAGEFNEVLRLFHDEQQVRAAAFATVERAVSSNLMHLVTQKFFKTPMHFDDFSQFEAKVIKVTHTHHALSPVLHDAVKAEFEKHMTATGANFFMPIRVDLLQKNAI